LTVGGTSAGAPQWAALMAIADQGRAAAFKAPLGSADTLSAVYAMPGTNFHDITSGNNGYAATTGYDLVTGRGTPKANLVIGYLVNSAMSSLAVPSGGGGASGGGPAAPGAVPVYVVAPAGPAPGQDPAAFLVLGANSF